MRCLWCMKEQVETHSWSSFLFPKPKTTLCEPCFKKLHFLKGQCCRKCARETNEEICEDCLLWKRRGGLDSLEYNKSIFKYNDFIQAIISRWKYRGDYILGEIFKTYFIQTFKKEFATVWKEAVIVPIPLSAERLAERGFNQAGVLAEFLPGEKKELFTRLHSEKQAKKSRNERISTKNPFKLEEKVKKPVVLVDDIYTTGTTIRQAAKLLKEGGCPKVYSVTLVRG